MQKLTIVKVGGKVVEDVESLMKLLEDFSRISGRKILVHGGGKSATAMAEKLGVKTEMTGGRRITNKEMLDVVLMVYGGLINKNIVAKCQALGMNSVGLTGADLNIIKAVKRPVKDIDYGYAGDVVSVQAKQFENLLESGAVPVVAPLTHDGRGLMLNTNADTMAAETAKALADGYEVTLVYCFEKPGVLMDPDDDNSVIPVLSYSDFKKYQKDGIISEGMIPKLDNGFDALMAGVKDVIISNPESIVKLNDLGTHLAS
ncbi:MAG: acetylglutamate kinase [Chlorobi bacterium]|nr:acetylglutamate kinase [Chlorobiota bacterium]